MRLWQLFFNPTPLPISLPIDDQKTTRSFGKVSPPQISIPLPNGKQHSKDASLLDLTFYFDISVMCFQDFLRDG